jgi:capsular exopolysaccharide synthesis family protein
MSNEIQLALNGYGQGLAAPASPYGGALGAPGGGNQPNALKTMHRVMRGRYIMAGVLASIFAVLFAAGGFLVSKPAYKSDAKLEIDPGIPLPGEPVEKVMAMQGLYVTKQMVHMTDERTLLAAMNDPRWKALRPNPDPKALEKFTKNLTVEQPPRTSNFITVTYSENTKDAKLVVQTAVACVIKAFKEIYGQEDNVHLDINIEALSREADALNLKIEGLLRDNDVLGKDGADDPDIVKAHDLDALATLKQLNDDRLLLQSAKDDKDQAEQGGNSMKFTVDDFGRVDPRMANEMKEYGDDLMHFNTLSNTLGPNNPAVRNARAVLDSRMATMQAYADQLNERFVIRWRADGTGGALIPRDLTNLKKVIQRSEELYQRQAKQVADMRANMRKINQNNVVIQQQRLRVKEINDELRQLVYVREHAVHTKYLDEEGTQAALDKDRRPILAALGFMGGAGLPIGVMLLIGMFDSRYRFSDETNSEMKGLTLLGILPNLPDRLSDPEQAGIAAHCVHQIRTMLQINGGPEERRVVAITSASPGDGKTSLTLALGLSYAACGTRTLLIDCDLIGAGLTARMNVSAAEGVLEAIANRSLLPYIRTTDIADVAILPVGSAGNLHASTLSPAALRRMVEEAEKHFDIVLVDTGPILGSIEASLVCAAADAVVLTVSRGQQRPMVEKSLGHLAAIGARLAGVVFNRAQAQDFERSISGVSMRSVGVPNASRSRASQAEAVARFAPVASAGAPMAGQDDSDAQEEEDQD